MPNIVNVYIVSAQYLIVKSKFELIDDFYYTFLYVPLPYVERVLYFTLILFWKWFCRMMDRDLNLMSAVTPNMPKRFLDYSIDQIQQS